MVRDTQEREEGTDEKNYMAGGLLLVLLVIALVAACGGRGRYDRPSTETAAARAGHYCRPTETTAAPARHHAPARPRGTDQDRSSINLTGARSGCVI
jgi:hypothetical protein